MKDEYEIIEEYILVDEKRFRVLHKPSGTVLNVAAENREEALDKARRMASRIGL